MIVSGESGSGVGGGGSERASGMGMCFCGPVPIDVRFDTRVYLLVGYSGRMRMRMSMDAWLAVIADISWK